jgi:cardiolipin synthase
MLLDAREPVRVHTAQGALSHAQTEKILADLRQRSPETNIIDRHVAVEEALNGTPLSAGNRVTLLEDGAATYPAMLAAIRGARHNVHLETYIFEADEVGREFARALIERRRAGVEVRVIYDAVGSMKTPRAFFEEMANAGIEVVEFNPVTPGTVLTQGPMLNRRDHRKLTVVDGRVAFVGGINISGVYGTQGVVAQKGGSGIASSGADEDAPFEQRPWRDTQVKLEGPVVADFQRTFLRMWARLLGQPMLSGPAYFPKLEPKGPHLARALEGWLANGLNPGYVTLISAIESAETDVRVTMAYFVPHEELLESLTAAARRGVKVDLVLPGRTDHWLVLEAGRSYYEDLLEAGVRIHERSERLLHAKTATVDGVWSTVGSTNLDWRSLLHNDEIGVVVLAPEFAAQMNRLFDRDVDAATPITRESWERRPLKDRMREWVARAWAQLL